MWSLGRDRLSDFTKVMGEGPHASSGLYASERTERISVSLLFLPGARNLTGISFKLKTNHGKICII